MGSLSGKIGFPVFRLRLLGQFFHHLLHRVLYPMFYGFVVHVIVENDVVPVFIVRYFM